MTDIGKVAIRRRTLDILLDIIEEREGTAGQLTAAERAAINQAYEALEEGKSNSPLLADS